MRDLALAHASWLTPFVALLEERGIDITPYLEASRIEPELALSGDGWITKTQLYRCIQSIAEAENLPELGFLAGERIQSKDLGDIGKAIKEAETLGESLRTFCHLINRHVENEHCWLEEAEPGQVWLLNHTLDYISGIGDIPEHTGLMSMINLIRPVAGEHWHPQHASLQALPTDAISAVKGLRETEVHFEAEATGFTFPAEWLLAPLPQGEAKVTASAGDSNGLLAGSESTVEKVTLLIEAIIGVGGISPTATLMAELCQTSERSFHRRLKASGTSYRQLLDEVRLSRAHQLLRDEHLPVEQVAIELGYSGANNFIRAFRRLVGQTPSAYRLKHQDLTASPTSPAPAAEE